jgi:hypothetical protein
METAPSGIGLEILRTVCKLNDDLGIFVIAHRLGEERVLVEVIAQDASFQLRQDLTRLLGGRNPPLVVNTENPRKGPPLIRLHQVDSSADSVSMDKDGAYKDESPMTGK